MNCGYEDIRSRIAEKPRWFDEHAVPRYCEFTPKALADIYATEAVLAEIACNGCGHKFNVAISFNYLDAVRRNTESLEALIKSRCLHYGDPPNVGCCASGPTMNSDMVRVIEYWRMGDDFEWVRDHSLEVTFEDAA